MITIKILIKEIKAFLEENKETFIIIKVICEIAKLIKSIFD